MSEQGFGVKFLASLGDQKYVNRVAEMSLKCGGFGDVVCDNLCEWACWYRNCGGLYTYRCTTCLVKEIASTQGHPDMQPLVIKHADEAWPVRHE